MTPDSLQSTALSVASERSVEAVLNRVVSGLAAQPGIALARVWLVGPGDICETCPMRSECPSQTRCLHLAASAGSSRIPGKGEWGRLDGAFRRFPLGVRKIGRIGATGLPLMIEDLQKDATWVANPTWAREEGIRTFGGQPLVFRGEILGVLAVFNRQRCDSETFAWLRFFADLAAVALANSRAFAEIDELKDRLENENRALRDEVTAAAGVWGLLGEGEGIRRVRRQIELAGPTPSTVLVTGESGTGKELVARALHEASPRRPRPLVKVNAAAIPRELFESEFFGHAKGAFTGALRDRIGRFQAADGGTLFLDEIGEVPIELQGKLLRVLQEREFERVGEERTRQVDVRLVAATNRDLARESAAGRFREDLYYRLSVFPIHVPPLRERLEDVPVLAAHFLEAGARKLRVKTPRLTPGDLALLSAYAWPGNVRELQSVLERALISAGGGRLHVGDAMPRSAVPAPPTVQATHRILTARELKALALRNLEAALEASGGRIYGPDGAAERIGIPPTTFVSQLRVARASGTGARRRRAARR